MGLERIGIPTTNRGRSLQYRTERKWERERLARMRAGWTHSQRSLPHGTGVQANVLQMMEDCYFVQLNKQVLIPVAQVPGFLRLKASIL
jgi:hypothetical protein